MQTDVGHVLGDWHSLAIEQMAVVSLLEAASNFWMEDTCSLFEIFKPDYFLLKIQVNILSRQILLDRL